MRTVIVAVGVALVAAVLFGGTLAAHPGGPSDTTPAGDRLLTPVGGESESRLWPYTSRSPSVEGRTLALNVLVRGSPERVRAALTDADSRWRPAHGSVRYTYVVGPDGTGEWRPSDYQVEVGTYLGSRTHARAYGPPSGDWTALQLHTEYWDWFRLRHTVTGVPSGARFLASDLVDEPFVRNVSEVRHGFVGGGSPGRWTVVEFVPAALLGAGVGLPVALVGGWGRTRVHRELGLALALAGLVVGVRVGGLAAELALGGLPPKLAVAVGYPLLVAGPPLLVHRLAPDRPTGRVAVLATGGLLAGLALDALVVGVHRYPASLVGHRLALAATLGLLAAGVARGDRRVRALALGGWLVALVVPLADLI
ncbi:hypothetical protein ACFQML_15420 [Salinirubellus salinus]